MCTSCVLFFVFYSIFVGVFLLHLHSNSNDFNSIQSILFQNIIQWNYHLLKWIRCIRSHMNVMITKTGYSCHLYVRIWMRIAKYDTLMIWSVRIAYGNCRAKIFHSTRFEHVRRLSLPYRSNQLQTLHHHRSPRAKPLWLPVHRHLFICVENLKLMLIHFRIGNNILTKTNREMERPNASWSRYRIGSDGRRPFNVLRYGTSVSQRHSSGDKLKYSPTFCACSDVNFIWPKHAATVYSTLRLSSLAKSRQFFFNNTFCWRIFAVTSSRLHGAIFKLNAMKFCYKILEN